MKEDPCWDLAWVMKEKMKCLLGFDCGWPSWMRRTAAKWCVQYIKGMNAIDSGLTKPELELMLGTRHFLVQVALVYRQGPPYMQLWACSLLTLGQICSIARSQALSLQWWGSWKLSKTATVPDHTRHILPVWMITSELTGFFPQIRRNFSSFKSCCSGHTT